MNNLLQLLYYKKKLKKKQSFFNPAENQNLLLKGHSRAVIAGFREEALSPLRNSDFHREIKEEEVKKQAEEAEALPRKPALSEESEEEGSGGKVIEGLRTHNGLRSFGRGSAIHIFAGSKGYSFARKNDRFFPAVCPAFGFEKTSDPRGNTSLLTV